MSPQIFPPHWCDPRDRRDAERLVYSELSHQLSDEFIVIHDMAWISARRYRRTPFVQADFLICHPELGVIVLEVKGGVLFRRDRIWYQRTRNGAEIPCKLPPHEQAKEAAFQVYQKMQDITGKQFPLYTIAHAVCFPDCDLDPDVLDATLDTEIVIQRRDLTDLTAALFRVRDFWKSREILFRYRNHQTLDVAWISFLRDSFAKDIDLQALLGPTIDIEKRDIKRLSDEQANVFFASQVQRRIAVPGCAGSGKTLLAQMISRKLAVEGNSVLLCCYNRPLKDYLVHVMADVPDVTVKTFDMLCHEIAEDLHNIQLESAAVSL